MPRHLTPVGQPPASRSMGSSVLGGGLASGGSWVLKLKRRIDAAGSDSTQNLATCRGALSGKVAAVFSRVSSPGLAGAVNGRRPFSNTIGVARRLSGSSTAR